jgi:hypothetical protein
MPMAEAVAAILEETAGQVHVLWKMKTKGDISGNHLPLLKPYIDAGTLRVVEWLTIDPASLLESGAVTIAVHHGGSSSYHEAVL